jgi:hypothetical protein
MAPSWKRGAQKPEDEDEDIQLRRSEPQWAAVVAERHRETLRQGALLGREHVKSEETLRPFCRTQQRQQQPYRQRHAEDRSSPDEQHATLFWDSHRARPFNQSASFSLSWDGVRPSPRGGRAGATHRVGHDVSASDFYDAPPPARTRSPNASLREQATIGAAPSSSPPPPPSQEYALDLETTCVDLHALSPRGLETMRAAAEREGARGATRWASMAVAAAAAGGAEPGVGSEPAPPLLDMTVDSVLGSGGADSGGGDALFPAGEELVFWSDGELRDFCAKRELDHGGERAALVERVTGVLRADTSARLSTVTDKLPAGVCVRACVCVRVRSRGGGRAQQHAHARAQLFCGAGAADAHMLSWLHRALDPSDVQVRVRHRRQAGGQAGPGARAARAAARGTGGAPCAGCRRAPPPPHAVRGGGGRRGRAL